MIIPAGAIDQKRRRWRVKSGGFLFSHKALAKVYRAKMLKGLLLYRTLYQQPFLTPNGLSKSVSYRFETDADIKW